MNQPTPHTPRIPGGTTPRLPEDLEAQIERALAEDVGSGDVTSALVDAATPTEAYVRAKEPAVICGAPWFNATMRKLDASIQTHWRVPEGQSVKAGDIVCTLQGPARALLTGERTALNFLQTLSGTATLTRKFVERLRGTKTEIVDTRKTLPGFRSAQKYAVTVGGGVNHRHGLYDAYLIKENHIFGVGSLTEALQKARAAHPELPLMAEAENIEQVKEALECKADILLLDDFPTHLLSKAVAMARDYRRYNKAYTRLEASGGVNLLNVRDIADTGVDRISVGALTKSAPAIDFSMRFGAPEDEEKA